MLVTPIDAPLGARVEGLDLSQPLSTEQAAQVKAAFLRHDGVLVFPGQQVSPPELAAFGRQFGELIVHPFFEYNHPQAQEVFVLSNVEVDGKKQGLDGGGSHWHSDYSYRKMPALCTILYGHQIPATGGDTHFLNMYKAYQALDAATQDEVGRLQGLNRLEHGGAPAARDFPPPGFAPPPRVAKPAEPRMDEKFKAENVPVPHPVVRVHPETGRKCMFIHPSSTLAIAGLPEDISRAMLYRLFAQMTQPQFVYSHKWHRGDVVMWDNRCTMHAATTAGMPKSQARTVHRVTVQAPCF